MFPPVTILPSSSAGIRLIASLGSLFAITWGIVEWTIDQMKLIVIIKTKIQMFFLKPGDFSVLFSDEIELYSVLFNFYVVYISFLVSFSYDLNKYLQYIIYVYIFIFIDFILSYFIFHFTIFQILLTLSNFINIFFFFSGILSGWWLKWSFKGLQETEFNEFMLVGLGLGISSIVAIGMIIYCRRYK